MDREKVIEGLEKLRKDLGYGLPDRSDVVMEYLNSLTDAITMLKERQEITDIRDVDGLWYDDITFCQETCERMDCPRNKHHIRDRSVPHSYSVEIPQDCLKKQEGR